MTRLLTVLALTLLASAAHAEGLDVLVEERAREKLGATLSAEAEFEISYQAEPESEPVMLSDFWMDPATGQFVANAVSDRGEIDRIVGLALVMVPVPVPTHRLMPDDILSESDLETIRLPQGRVGAFAVTDPADLVGMQVRRVLSKGRPVTAQAVMEPLVIARGDDVSIRYSDGALKLSAPGRALARAHRGQPIRIVNLVSNASLTGIAAGDGVVEVQR